MDFTCVIAIFGNQVFILVILDHLKRELIFLNATLSPSREWVSQQIRNFHFEYESPDAMIFDRDGIYGAWLGDYLLNHFLIVPLQTPVRSPWLNGWIERFHRTLKEELIHPLGSFDLAQVKRHFSAYRHDYNQSRPHQALGGRSPLKTRPAKIISLDQIRGHRKTKTICGLISRFELAC
jgi:putative transposase